MANCCNTCTNTQNTIHTKSDFQNKLAQSRFTLDSVITEKEYFDHFGDFLHPFTGINMVSFYKELIESESCKVEFVFSAIFTANLS